MEITVLNDNQLKVTGHFNAMEDYYKLVEVTDSLVDTGVSSLKISFSGTKVISSSIIGYFVKLITVNKIHLVVTVTEPYLFRLLEAMRITDTLNVKIENDD